MGSEFPAGKLGLFPLFFFPAIIFRLRNRLMCIVHLSMHPPVLLPLHYSIKKKPAYTGKP